MERLGSLVLFFALGQVELVDAALADQQKQPIEVRASVRWLTLANIPAEEREEKFKVLCGHVNEQSKETEIYPLQIVPGTAGALLRLSIDDYGWDAATWDKLADADPYYHRTLEQVEEPVFLLPYVWKKFPDNLGQSFLYSGKKLIGGLDHATGQYRPWEGSDYGKKTQPPFPYGQAPSSRRQLPRRVLAEELGPRAIQLVAGANSRAPILRADWFFQQTAAAENRTPNYYDFLGVKTETDFQKLIGFDAKKKRRKVELREAVARSGVSPNERGIVREVAEDGFYWKTFDFKLALNRVNPLRVLGRDLEAEFKKADVKDVATEQLGTLPNGFTAWFLGNNKGERQDSAPDFAATDSFSRTNDKKVHIRVSCRRCHNNGAIKDIRGWVRNLIQPPLALSSPDYKVYRELRTQYLRQLEPFIDKDRSIDADAIKTATGWDARTYAAKYAAFWESYVDFDVDVARAARDVGLSEKDFVNGLRAYAVQTRALDPVLSTFLEPGDSFQPISIRQWEEVFPLAMQALKGVRR